MIYSQDNILRILMQNVVEDHSGVCSYNIKVLKYMDWLSLDITE